MTPRPRLLLVDDDLMSCRLLRDLFTPEGYEVSMVGSGEAALESVRSALPDAVILDLKLPGIGGVEVLEQLKLLDRNLPVIMLTGAGDIPSAVRATRLGAFAYLAKGLSVDEIVVVTRRAIESRRLAAEVEELRRRLGDEGGLARKMGGSRAIEHVIEQVARVADSGFAVLIEGETGTGKELVAHALHLQSARREQPFVAVDCGALPESLVESELFGHEKGAFTGADKARLGHFRLAEGGTLFLDEIANLPMSMQARLLRVLQEKRLRPVGGSETIAVDVRFVAATNRDLEAAVADGSFRQDLYFRLAEFTIVLPPLRSRPVDIPFLAWRFAQETAVELRRPICEIDPEALEALNRHPWTGNVRELRNVIRRAVLQSTEPVIHAADLHQLLESAPTAPEAHHHPTASDLPEPSETSDPRSLREIGAAAVAQAEKAAITHALAAARGNKSEAARALRTDYKTLHVKIKLYGLGESRDADHPRGKGPTARDSQRAADHEQ